MVNQVLSSKLLSQAIPAYRINSTYENGSVKVEINNTWRKWVLVLLYQKLFPSENCDINSKKVISTKDILIEDIQTKRCFKMLKELIFRNVYNFIVGDVRNVYNFILKHLVFIWISSIKMSFIGITFLLFDFL